MYERQARAMAARMARETDKDRYVVYDPSDADSPEDGYFVATLFDLDTFFAGAEVVAEFRV